MKRVLLILSLIFILVGCSKNQEEGNEGESKMILNQAQGYQEGNIKATMKTNMGDIELILFPNVAPKAVENFTTHAKNGYYDGVTFHRVIEDFMIQGGDPQGTGMGGDSIWGSSFEDEFAIDYRNFYGALSMANAGPNTNGSQFFIVTAKEVPSQILDQMRQHGPEAGYPDDVVDYYEEVGGAFHLDGRHTVFGQVVQGMDVVEAISKLDTDTNDKPLEPVIIESIQVHE